MTHRQFQRVYQTLCESLEIIEEKARERGIRLRRNRTTSEPRPAQLQRESPESPPPQAVAVPAVGAAERDAKIECFLQSKVGDYADMYCVVKNSARTKGEEFANDLADRLCSFTHYSGENYIQLALAGFSGGNGTVVFCNICLLFAKDLEESDDVKLFHKICSPECEFTKNWQFAKHKIENVDTQEMLERCKMEW